MRIIIAPNAFKNSLDATAVAESIHKGLNESNLDCDCRNFPVGDGGDGTAELLNQFYRAARVAVDTTDALGRKITASFGFITLQETAVIEMADASGLRQLKQEEYQPLLATTFGTGTMIKAALDHGARKILLGIGGSATVDGACGILQALGVRFLDDNNEGILDIPAGLGRLRSIDLSAMDKRIYDVELIVLCDIDNPLLGNNGSANVFGPQKGANPEMIVQLENALSRLRDIVLAQIGFDMAALEHGGSAGGVAAGLAAIVNAKLVNGIEFFLDITGFDDALKYADLAITGEGSLDEQTLSGKAPFGVARRAKRLGLPVFGLAGSVPAYPSDELTSYFDVLMAIGNEPSGLREAMANTALNLERMGKNLGNALAVSNNMKVKI